MPSYRRLSRVVRAGVAALLLPAAALALHHDTPPAARITHGDAVAHPSTRSWGYFLAFSSTEDLANTGSTGRQIFVFRLFDYVCQVAPHTGDLSSCPSLPTPYIVQATAGPGNPDNPSATRQGGVVAFEADGAYDGGTGPGVGRRQIFVRNFDTTELIRVTDAPDGDSIRPSLDENARNVVFESTAALRPGPSGVSQIYVYSLRLRTLTRVTAGAGPSTAPMPTKLGRIVAFESTADLLGDGHDTGISQIFWSDTVTGALHQLTAGNGPSRRPYITKRMRSALKKLSGGGAGILFESSATDLPGTAGGPGTQIYVGGTKAGDLPPIIQLTPTTVPGCTPPSVGDATYPAFEHSGRRIIFLSTGDLLCNGTSGSRAFMLDPKRLPTTLYQLTGTGNIAGPIGASLGGWFLTLSTTKDLSGQGVCGAQLHVLDFYTGRWQPAALAGEIPNEPPPGNPAASCDDGDACTTDTCVADACTHTPIVGCP
jgi:Tol biopolymer transport system component